MKHSIACFFGLLYGVTGVCAELPAPVLAALARAQVPASAMSLVLEPVGGSGFAHQAAVPMNPASTMKLLTTVAAFDQLGAEFRWQTEMASVGAVMEGALTAPLAIKGGGDPKFTWEHLDWMLLQLRAQGVERLPLGVILDRSRFAAHAEDPAQFDGQGHRPYNVGPSALLLNFKSVGLKFKADAATKQVVVSAEPWPTQLQLDNRLRYKEGVCGDWRGRLKPTLRLTANAAGIALNGQYAVDCGEREWYLSVLDHDAFFEGVLRAAWSRLGGKALGPVRPGLLPDGARVLVRYQSAPLPVAVADINKNSNNVMARQLLLSLDAAKQGAPATTQRAALGLAAWLRERGITAAGLVVENGSGLSRKERMSARLLADLLQFAVRQPYASEFVSSLPVASVDGTLANRLRQIDSAGSAYLKTGTLNDVRALAGYIDQPSGQRAVFVAIVNHPNAPAAQAALDAAVHWAFAAPMKATP